MPGDDPYRGWGLLQCSPEVLGVGQDEKEEDSCGESRDLRIQDAPSGCGSERWCNDC